MPQAPGLFVDAPVRSVAWRDLVALRTGERLRELLLPVPWLLLGLFAARHGLWMVALAGSRSFLASKCAEPHRSAGRAPESRFA